MSNMLPFTTAGATPAAYLGPSRKRMRDHQHDAAAASEAYRFGHVFMIPRDQLQGGGADAGGRIGSAMVSTSGRLQTTTTPQVFSVPPPLVSPPAASASTNEAYMLSQFQLQHGIDVDHLLGVHDEKLRLAIRDIRRRHYLQILSTLDRRVQQYLEAKQSEIRAALIRRSELEDQLRQAEAQRDAWAAEANKGDAIVNELYSRLNQGTIKTLTQGGGYSCANEGSGDNGNGEGLAEAEEGESRCYGWAQDERDTCAGNERNSTRRATAMNVPGCCRLCCRGKEASVVLLPCRHLCLCQDCDQAAEGAAVMAPLACPVCGVYRNATLRIAPYL